MKSILIIEDERQQALAYQIKLSKNYDVEVATTSDEALDKVFKKKYDLIILDIMLPGNENGFDFLKKLKSNPKTQSTPVMVVTNLDEDTRKTALSLGAIDYVVKSESSLEQLASRVDIFLK